MIELHRRGSGSKMMTNEEIYDRWVEAQRQRISEWKRTGSKKKFVGERGYLHFDGKISFRDHIDTGGHTINDVLKTESAIAGHKFLPFIRDDQRVRKFRDKKKVTPLGEIRKHHQRFSTIKNRPIMYAAHRDACIYSMYGQVLYEEYEKKVVVDEIDSAVLAYRRIPLGETQNNKSNIDFANDLHKKILGYERVGVLMADMSHFFDTIDHDKLENRWTALLDVDELPPDHAAVFKSLTRFRYVFKKEVYTALALTPDRIKVLSKRRFGALTSPRVFNSKISKASLIRKNKSGSGIPQGSPISGLLANIYMCDFDKQIYQYVKLRGGHYARYSDDIVILIDESMLKEAYEFMKSLIRDDKIEINDKKTDAFTFDKTNGQFTNALDLLGIPHPFNQKQYPQYLGFTLRDDGMLIRSNTLARRFRGNDRLNSKRWKYFELSEHKTGSKAIHTQVKKVRKKIKRENS